MSQTPCLPPSTTACPSWLWTLSVVAGLALPLSVGCTRNGPTPAVPTASDPVAVDPAPTAADPPTPAETPTTTAPPGDPASLYAQCRERVEGAESEGECSTDADCSTGGCSGEICATPAALEGLMSTCEILPCFAVLDSCGCVEGRCTWSVSAAASGTAAPPVVLPPKSSLDQPAAPSEPAGD